ncbi:MAG: hypothetical protein IMY80_05185 [Chloroflexi bacterium]|nr:hypothetical protein [Chloroflexota bacterium]
MSSPPNPPDDIAPCPVCGEPMQLLPTLNGSHAAPICLQCLKAPEPGFKSFEPKLSSAPPSKDDSSSRFRKILAEEQRTKDNPLPGWMMDELPEEARRLLSGHELPTGPSLGPKLSDDLAKALRDQGYVIHEDEKGMHLGGALVSRGGTPAAMSPYDVIRMAADMEGGLAPPDELLRCKKCDALIPHGDERCQWCGESAV